MEKNDIKVLFDDFIDYIENKERGYATRAKVNALVHFRNNKAATKDDVEKIKTPYFSSEEKLNQERPNASEGSKAWVGAEYPGTVWVVKNGKWEDTGKVPPAEEVNLENYAENRDVSHFNATEYLEIIPPSYATLEQAISAVPSKLRKTGLVISFRASQFDWQQWLYIASDIGESTFLNLQYWHKLAGISDYDYLHRMDRLSVASLPQNALFDNVNLFRVNHIIPYSVSSDGGEVFSLRNFTSHYKCAIVPIFGAKELTLSGWHLSEGKSLSILDTNLSVVDTRNLNNHYSGDLISIDGNNWNKPGDIHLTLPQNILYYIAFNVATTNDRNYYIYNDIQLEVGLVATTYRNQTNTQPGLLGKKEAIEMYAQKANIINNIPTLNIPYSRFSVKNLYSKSYLGDFYADTTSGVMSVINAGLQGYKAVLIPIVDGQEYTLSGYDFEAGKAISILDANYSVLDTRNLKVEYKGNSIMIDGDNWSELSDIHIKTTAKAQYLLINVASNQQPDYWRHAKLQLEKGEKSTAYQKGAGGLRGYLTLDDLDSIVYTSKRAGEKILWFGTSIPWAGYNGKQETSYPNIIGRNLGANVINEAESSSQVRYAFTDGLEFDKDHQRLAFCLTKAERKLRGVSEDYGFEKKMLASDRIDADLFVFDFGINDAHRDTVGFNIIPKRNADGTYNIEGLTDDYILREEDGELELLPDWQNRKTFIGAMNFVIVELLKIKPKARFVFITHHENQCPRDVNNIAIDGSTRRSKFNSSIVCEAQEVLAKYWGAPILKLYELTGWSQVMVNGKTIYNHFVNDQLHPNQDSSGYSIEEVLAKPIGAWMETV